jgi:sensor histidine kinase YesM
MERKQWKRRKYFIHPSVQLKYIGMSILPALVIGVFCTHILITTGEFIVDKERQKVVQQISSMTQILQQLVEEDYPPEIIEKVLRLRKEMFSFQKVVKDPYENTLKEWNRARKLILGGVSLILLCTAIAALVYSHQIAGPLYRIKKYIDMLAEGQDIPPVKVRTHDEFKEVAESLDKLRERLKEKNVL